MPRLPRTFRLSVALSLCAAAALAVDFTALKPQGYVSDFAGVVDPESRAALERYCTALEKATGVELALVTLPSLEGEPVEDVANALYRAWGVGKKGTNEGALLLLSIRDRRSRLEVGYGLEPIITDGDSGSVLRAMSPELREGRYGPALLQAAYELGDRIAQAKNVAISEEAPRPRRRSAPAEPLSTGLPIGAILMGLAFLFFLSRLGRGGSPGCSGCLAGFLLGNLLGGRGGWGSSWGSGGSGGGFGGYDSGGGFGGFGGGDSGGGGASGSW